MASSTKLLPLYYGSIRESVLDFSKTLYSKGHDAIFADDRTGTDGEGLPQFKLSVYEGAKFSSALLFELTYTQGQEIMEVDAYQEIEAFEDGVYISDGYLTETLELLLRNAVKK
jgi:hypothetical protein